MAILQTRDGYLWLSTSDGLVRFDGVRFTVFNKGNIKGIDSNRFNALFEDSHGTLWAGTDDRGITRYKDGEFKTFTVEDGLPDYYIWAIREDSAGKLLVITGHGLAQSQGERFIPYVPEGNISATRYWDQKRGGLSFYDASGLYKFEGGSYRAFTDQDGLSSRNIVFIYEDQYGTLWVTTRDRKLYRLKDGASTIYSIKELPDINVSAVSEDRDGNIWIAHGGGVSRLKDGRIFNHTEEQGAPGKAIINVKAINSIYVDRENNIWMGSNGGGLFRAKRQVITAYAEREGLAYENVVSVLEDREGSIWIGTRGRGLDQLKDGSFRHYTKETGLASNLVTGLLEDREGGLWVGSNDSGVTRLKDGRLTVYYEEAGFFGSAVTAIYQDLAGSIWFGTSGGLIEYRDESFRRHTTAQGLVGRDVHVINQDRAGRLWFGTHGGLSSYKDGQFTNYTEREGLSSNHVRAIYEDDEGTLWFGTYDGGMNRFKDGKFTRYTVNDGLFNNGVFRILEDARGNFWISSNRGIFRVSRKELNDFAEGKINSITSVSYDKSDGMLNSECNGGTQPAGWKARDGRLWFPTQGGVVVIDPEALQQSPPPPVHIEKVLLDQQPAGLRNAVQITPGIDNVEIHFTGLSFTKPEQVRFKYKLAGFDNDWVDPRTRRTAYYTKLPPGEYEFTVIAANSDGVWNMQGASVRIVVVPPFWRTWWFFSLVLLSCFALVFFAYRRRILKLKRANLAQQAFASRLIKSQESERKRIAAELHDSLGQQLLVIKNRALVALQTSESREEAAEQLNEISDATSQALDEVREIAYNLRPFQLDRLGLTKAIESMLKKVSTASGIKFFIMVDQIDGLYSQEAEINLYRIVQESANNIVRHSGATQAEVEIKRDQRGVNIKIHDDGKGFDHDSAADKSYGAGMGIAGISERARILGGKYKLHSIPGQGTTLIIQLGLQNDHSENADEGQ